ncbi:MAG TPA: sugar phosphate isomerase/epimerase [Armatimonadota bacterium]|jgi:sugar phosphate isomerase/epimerase
MAFGLIHYNAPGDNLVDFLDFVAEAGFECVEIACADVWPQDETAPEARAAQVAQMLADRGLAASALAAGNNFCVDQEEAIQAQVARMKRVCGLADILGTKILRTDGGWPGEDPRPVSEWVPWMVECFRRCLEFVEPAGIKLAVDNHGLTTNEWPVQLEIFEQVGSPALGANLDTMNYRWFGHSVEKLHEIYAAIAPYVMHTHFKDGTGSRADYQGTVLGEGEIPLEFAIKCLKDANYAGPWIVEYEGPRDDGTGYRKGLEWLRAHV